MKRNKERAMTNYTGNFFGRACCAGLVTLALLSPVHAALLGTDQAAADKQTQQERQRVADLLTRPDVKRHLEALGVQPELAQKRVDAMTDEEVHQIAGRLDALPAGGTLNREDLLLILLITILVALVI